MASSQRYTLPSQGHLTWAPGTGTKVPGAWDFGPPADRHEHAEMRGYRAAGCGVVQMRRPVMWVGMMRMNCSLGPLAHACTPSRATEASSASESTKCAEPWIRTLHPSCVAGLIWSTSKATLYSASDMRVRRSSSIELRSEE